MSEETRETDESGQAAEPSSAPAAKKEREAAAARSSPARAAKAPAAPTSIYLVPYPKVILLYPILLASIAAAIGMHIAGGTGDQPSRAAVVIAEIFLGVTAVNLVILAFDFPRTTSLTLFFLAVALIMGFILLVTFKPDIMPFLKDSLSRFHPSANATFYWAIAGCIAVIYFAVFVSIRFDYWEVRPNELLHHHGMLSNLERLSAPNLRIEKEINDIFEYFLLRSGRLILSPSDDRRPIVLDNVPFIDRKEEAITQMLGALQVQIRREG